MNKFICVALISLISWGGASALYRFRQGVNNYNDNEFDRPYARNFAPYVPAKTEEIDPAPAKVKLQGPFDITSYLVESCKNKIPLEPRVVNDAVKCLENSLTDDILSQSLILLAQRQYQQFGAQACKAWPEVNNCLTEVVAYLEECQEKQYIGKVTDTILNYLCSTPEGAPAGTNNFGDFLMAGGLSCVDINGFSQCMKDSNLKETNKADFCATVKVVRDCGKASFKGCFSPKPWEILANGLDDLESKFACDGKLLGASETIQSASAPVAVSQN